MDTINAMDALDSLNQFFSRLISGQLISGREVALGVACDP
jgi:hypothetical protein